MPASRESTERPSLARRCCSATSCRACAPKRPCACGSRGWWPAVRRSPSTAASKRWGCFPSRWPPAPPPPAGDPGFARGPSSPPPRAETADGGEPLYVRLSVRNTGDGAASRLVLRGQLPPHTAYLPGSTLVNGVPLLGVDGGCVLWSTPGLILEDVDPGVEVVVRFGTIVNTPLAAGTLIDAHLDLGWDGGGTLAVSSPAVRVRSTPAFAVRATGLPFSVSGIAPRTADVLHDIAEQRRAAQIQLPPPFAALPPPLAEPPAPPPAPTPAPPPDRASFRYDEDAIEARFTPAAPPPAPPAAETTVPLDVPPSPQPEVLEPVPPPVTEPPVVEAALAAPALDEFAMPDADVAAGAVAALPEQPERVDEIAHAQAPNVAESSPAPATPPAVEAAGVPPGTDPEPPVLEPHPKPAPPPPPPPTPTPTALMRRVRLVFAYDALERALRFLEQSDYGGLITHLFAIRTLLPTALVGINRDVPGQLAAEREALRGVVDRLFIKMRMPRYALTAKDLEDRTSRSALADLICSLEASKPIDEVDAGGATMRLEGPIDVALLTPHIALLESEPLGSARPWLLLAELLPSTFIVPNGGEAMNAYRSALISTFTNVAALPNEEFHRVLAGTQNAALDAALRDVRAALRDVLEAAAAKA